MPTNAPNLLLLCHANACRSALGQVAVWSASNQTLNVSSRALGQPAASICSTSMAMAIELAPGAGAAVATEHTPTMVNDKDLQAADVILTATLQQRSSIASAHPTLRSRLFTYREAAALLHYLDRAGLDLPTAAKEMNRVRGLAPMRSQPQISRRHLFHRNSSEPLDIPDAHSAGYAKRHRVILQDVWSRCTQIGQFLSNR